MSGGLPRKVGDAMANYAEHPERKEIWIVYDRLRSRDHHCLYLSGGLLLRCIEFQCSQSHQVGSIFESASAGRQRILAKVGMKKAADTLAS